MREDIQIDVKASQDSEIQHAPELSTERRELTDAKKEYLETFKLSMREVFGQEEIPEEIVNKMLDIRKGIKDDISIHEYVDDLHDSEWKIQSLTLDIIHFGEKLPKVNTFEEDEKGAIKVLYEDGSSENIDPAGIELLESLRNYFDSYRLVHNAGKFRTNVSSVQKIIVGENAARKLNFFSEDEKRDVLVGRIYEKYEHAGFTREEISELIKTCDIKDIDKLEIHEIKILSKIADVFSRFMEGDKTRYIGMSAALIIPAFLEGYAPMFLANAFKGGKMEMEQLTQIGLYTLLSVASIGSSTVVNKMFKDFLDSNFVKEEGFSDFVAKSTAELPGEEVESFGMERVKNRIAAAKQAYGAVLWRISFQIIPAAVTLLTSAVMLCEKSSVLAAGTAAGTGIMMTLDSYVEKRGKFWEKENRAETQREKMNQKMEELLNAHLEVILSGEKDNFSDKMDEMLSKERIAESDKSFLGIVRDKINRSFGTLNLVINSIVTYLSGGGSDKFIAALVYSGNFQEGMRSLIESKRALLSSFRDIAQMDLMFNGYAAEEKEKEKDRIGMSEIPNNNISLKNVSVQFNGKKIIDDVSLEIPGGSLVSLDGVSGAGKTTLMKVLSGYYKPTEGVVEIGSVDMDKIKKSGQDSMYSKIAYLSQFPYILEESVRNNIRFGIAGDVTDAEIRDVLEEVSLGHRFPDLNEKLKGGRGDAGTTSGGETSRIGLARAILKIRKNDSKIVFLDEPTASVDEPTANRIAEIINIEKQKNPEVTFVSISHDKNFNERLATSMRVRMEKGKIV